MPENDSFGTSLLDQSAKPLPWTKGGPNIDIRITTKNVVKFRARFRKKGHKDLFTTKFDLKSGKQWLAEQERSAFLGELHPTAMIGNKRTFSDAIKRYKEEELSKKDKDAKNRQHHLDLNFTLQSMLCLFVT